MVFTPRKQDLAVSIKDGRWSEQKARLLSSGLKIFYVLEGDFRNVAALPYGALVGAYLNASLLEGVEVFRTLNIQETKFLLVTLAKKCQATSSTPARGLVSSERRRIPWRIFGFDSLPSFRPSPRALRSRSFNILAPCRSSGKPCKILATFALFL